MGEAFILVEDEGVSLDDPILQGEVGRLRMLPGDGAGDYLVMAKVQLATSGEAPAAFVECRLEQGAVSIDTAGVLVAAGGTDTLPLLGAADAFPPGGDIVLICSSTSSGTEARYVKLSAVPIATVQFQP